MPGPFEMVNETDEWLDLDGTKQTPEVELAIIEHRVADNLWEGSAIACLDYIFGDIPMDMLGDKYVAVASPHGLTLKGKDKK